MLRNSRSSSTAPGTPPEIEAQVDAAGMPRVRSVKKMAHKGRHGDIGVVKGLVQRGRVRAQFHERGLLFV